MKVVQLCGWYFPDSLGGTETYVAALAWHLRAEGHAVTIAAPDPGAAGERNYEHEGAPVFRYPIAGTPTRAEARHEVPVRGAERLHAWLGRERPDIVHFHTFVTGVGPHEISAAKAAGSRVIVTTHSGALGFLCQRGTMMQWGRDACDGRVTPAKCAACALEHRGVPRAIASMVARIRPPLSRSLDRLPGRLGTALGMPALIASNRRRQHKMLHDVDAFVVLTDWAWRAVLSDSPATPVSVNRLGVREPPPRGATPQARQRTGPIRVAYVGRFDPIKGVHELARAVKALPADVPLRVEFRGPCQSASERQVVKRLTSTLSGDSRVTIGDAIPQDQIYDYLSSLDVLCCPSLTLEGGPTVALEAMAAGVPVIATRLGAMAEVVVDGENGCLVPPGDWRALSAALARVAADPEGTIDRWRMALPPVRTMRDVARHYLRTYARVTAEHA